VDTCVATHPGVLEVSVIGRILRAIMTSVVISSSSSISCLKCCCVSLYSERSYTDYVVDLHVHVLLRHDHLSALSSCSRGIFFMNERSLESSTIA